MELRTTVHNAGQALSGIVSQPLVDHLVLLLIGRTATCQSVQGTIKFL